VLLQTHKALEMRLYTLESLGWGWALVVGVLAVVKGCSLVLQCQKWHAIKRVST
jgi:hypothetical protein